MSTEIFEKVQQYNKVKEELLAIAEDLNVSLKEEEAKVTEVISFLKKKSTPISGQKRDEQEVCKKNAFPDSWYSRKMREMCQVADKVEKQIDPIAYKEFEESGEYCRCIATMDDTLQFYLEWILEQIKQSQRELGDQSR